MSRPALSALYKVMTKRVVVVAGSPVAPSLVSSPSGVFTSGTTSPITTTVNGIVAGNTVLAIVSTYVGGSAIDPTVTAPGYTFTSLGGFLQVGPDVGCRVFTAVAPGSGNITFTSTNSGTYKSLVVIQLQGVHADIIDVAPAVYDLEGVGGSAMTLPLSATTFSHDYVMGIYFWYDSDRVHTVDPAWPMLFGWNGGQSDRNQILVVGKQVTTTGVYAPSLTLGTPGTSVGGISLAFKGKNV